MCKKKTEQLAVRSYCINYVISQKHTHFCFILSANSTVVTDFPEIQEEKNMITAITNMLGEHIPANMYLA